MNDGPLPIAPGTEDFRALARSSPWRFTTLHFTHRRQRVGGSAPDGKPVEAWLDRSVGRVSVRTSRGIEVNDGVPYSTSSVLMVESGTAPPYTPEPPAELVLRPDGLVARRPEGWHVEHGDPMWQDYLWTAMLDPLELSYGVEIDDVEATTVRGRPTWAATCRPLTGKGEEWEGGYDPRCSCCPLLDSAVSRLVEYGPEDPTWSDRGLPTTYRVHLDVQTGIVVDIAPLDGSGGTSLTNEIHAVDKRLEVRL